MARIQQLLKAISADNIKTHIRNLEGIRHPLITPEALLAAENYIEHYLMSLGIEMMPHHFIENGQEFTNVIGIQRGLEYPDTKIMVMAHYDTVARSPGADDNASGIAAVLETARTLHSHNFQNSILYTAVNLEETIDYGENPNLFTRGSSALARYAREQGWNITGVINYETIAYAGDDITQTAPDNLPFSFPKKGNFIAVVGNENSTELGKGYIESIQQYQIHLPYLPIIVPGNGEMLPDTRRSDHAPFWDQGYPAIMLTDTANFRNPHYHQPSDTLDTLNLSFASDVCRAGAALVCRMAVYEGAE
jgi:Zn-dependent M28 family amino/carboxypeptidase